MQIKFIFLYKQKKPIYGKKESNALQVFDAHRR